MVAVVVVAKVVAAAGETVGRVVAVAVEHTAAVFVVAEHMVVDNAQTVDVVMVCTAAAEAGVDYVSG